MRVLDLASVAASEAPMICLCPLQIRYSSLHLTLRTSGAHWGPEKHAG